MSELKRYHFIQQSIDKLRESRKVNYLEIGVRDGFCFFKIKADRKLAVDPNFVINPQAKWKAYFNNFSNLFSRYYKLTSDDFFNKYGRRLEGRNGLDVVFIDGLHLYEQVVKDIENSLRYLRPDGIILLHDCNPAFEAAAVRGFSPAEIAKDPPPGWTGEWNGDVWKAIVHYRALQPGVEVAVFDADHGIGAIKKRGTATALLLSQEEIASLRYKDLEENRPEFLNLKEPGEFASFLNA